MKLSTLDGSYIVMRKVNGLTYKKEHAHFTGDGARLYFAKYLACKFTFDFTSKLYTLNA